MASIDLTRRTKIVATIGPATESAERIKGLIEAGATTFRLNFSHGDHKGHGACLERVREAAKAFPDKNIAILLDTKGPEVSHPRSMKRQCILLG